MGMYQCLRCGVIIERSERCLCPDCGFVTAEVKDGTPFSRKKALIKEIISVLDGLKYKDDAAAQISFSRQKSHNKNITLKEDQTRFPDFPKIYKYIREAPKTEIFFERVDTTLNEIAKYLHTPFSETYSADFSDLIKKVEEQDQIMQKACAVLDLQPEFSDITFVPLQLNYAEEPDVALLSDADILLGLLGDLSRKTKNFVKKNNLFGTAYKKTEYKSTPQGKEITLREAINRVEKILKKNVTVDIFSDGTDELKEYIKPMWFAIEALLRAPIPEKHFVYSSANGQQIGQENINSFLLDQIGEHYARCETLSSLNLCLESKPEPWLFDRCEKLLEDGSSGGKNVSGNNESEQRLNGLIGLDAVKQSIRKIKAYALANKDSEALNLHMCFLGNPGTGKTEVARIIAGILHENGILPTAHVVEVDRGGLIGQYVGETPQKTMRRILEAMGGVLFIDEAYALAPKDAGFDYGHEAVATLIKAMEDYRGKFCVILAGYQNEMKEMLSTNPGFQSRIQFTLNFENYSRDELKEIAKKMLASREYTASDQAMERMLDITDIRRKDPNFANAREVRNLLDQVIMCQNLRVEGAGDKTIEIADVNRYIKDAKLYLPTDGNSAAKKILTGEEELDQLIGLASVKRMIRKIKAYAKKNVGSDGFNLHMAFYGNPGTGKTEVARILSRILYDAGVLGGSKLVETDGLGLLGKSVGETAPKTLEKIIEAMNGVLFIDEAYALAGSGKGAANYGDEAIAVLLKEMEDRRGQFCVILAGYKKEMESLLSANPGFESRIQFTLEFPDFTREEFGEIAQRFLTKKKYEIEPDALELVLDIMDYYRKEPNFANARTLRNLLDQVIMNQNLRTEDEAENNVIIKSDVEDYLTDEKIDLTKQNRGSRHMGFI